MRLGHTSPSRALRRALTRRRASCRTSPRVRVCFVFYIAFASRRPAPPLRRAPHPARVSIFFFRACLLPPRRLPPEPRPLTTHRALALALLCASISHTRSALEYAPCVRGRSLSKVALRGAFKGAATAARRGRISIQNTCAPLTTYVRCAKPGSALSQRLRGLITQDAISHALSFSRAFARFPSATPFSSSSSSCATRRVDNKRRYKMLLGDISKICRKKANVDELGGY